jgi:hypothetical protein
MRTSIAFGLALGVLAFLTQDAAAQFMEKKVLTLAAARKMVAAAEGEAERHHLAGVVAVVDDGGWPISLNAWTTPPIPPVSNLRRAKQERRRCSRSRAGRSRMRLTTAASRP